MKCLELDSGYGLQLCEYSKNHYMVHFKGVNIRVCELYLNKKKIPVEDSAKQGGFPEVLSSLR